MCSCIFSCVTRVRLDATCRDFTHDAWCSAHSKLPADFARLSPAWLAWTSCSQSIKSHLVCANNLAKIKKISKLTSRPKFCCAHARRVSKLPVRTRFWFSGKRSCLRCVVFCGLLLHRSSHHGAAPVRRGRLLFSRPGTTIIEVQQVQKTSASNAEQQRVS